MTKRPLVDPNIFALAREWITECHVINTETADSETYCLDDAIWDLASEIQQTMETWLNDAEGSGRLRLLRGPS